MGVSVLKEWPRSRPVGNYSSHPKIDVEVLPEGDRHCNECGQVVVFDKDRGHWGEFVHADGSEGHHVRARSICRFCRSDEHMSHRMEAWYDASDCARCGGVDGFAIGD